MLADDIATVKRAIDLVGGPVIIVVPSYNNGKKRLKRVCEVDHFGRG